MHLHWKDKHELEVCFKFELAMIRSLDSSRDSKDKLLYPNQTVCNPQVAFSAAPAPPESTVCSVLPSDENASAGRVYIVVLP